MPDCYEYPYMSSTSIKTTNLEKSQPQRTSGRLRWSTTAKANTAQKCQTRQQLPRRISAMTTARTFGPKSLIVGSPCVDLQAFLALCMSQWDQYTEEEKRSIMESLPPSKRSVSTRRREYLEGDSEDKEKQAQINGHNPSTTSEEEVEAAAKDIDPEHPPMSPEELASDPYLKRATARFKRDLKDGYYEKAWQDKAKRAHEERLEGKFDEYLRQHAEKMLVDEEGAGDDEEDELAADHKDSDYDDQKANHRKMRKR